MRFKKIYVEILNSCNLNCSFCIKNSREPKMLRLEQFHHILTEIQPYTKYIYLHVLGEPLMHPQLKEFLELADSMNFHVNLTTNGTLLMNQLNILLEAKALRQINVSIHALMEQETYLKQVLEAGDALSNNHVYVSYRLWQYHNGTLDQAVLNTVQALNEHYQVNILPSKQSFQLKEHCFVSFDEEFEWPTLTAPYVSDTGTCQGWRHMAGILVDGTVVPCCLDSKGELPLGNIYEESFASVVQKHESLLEEMRRHYFSKELCQHCSYRTRFNK